VLEQDICGGGASGRNGGFVLSWWPKLSSLIKLVGSEDAVRIARHSESAISEIEQFCNSQHIDADFRGGGWLWTATTRAQMGAWEGLLCTCEQAGVCPFNRLEPSEVARLSGSSVHRAGVFDASAAIVQPAALVRGMRKVALELGVRIFEHTRVRTFTRDRPVTLRTQDGTLVAEKMVIAANAWAANIREFARSITVVSSDLVVSAPIQERLKEIGWNPDLCITDSQAMVDYYRVTRDRRIAFGKGGWTIALGGRIGGRFDRNPRRAAEVVADFRRYYPFLKDVPITSDWSGPIDRTYNGLPLIGHLGGRKHIVYGVGWSGNGVGPSVVGGKILASLALECSDEWGHHPLIDLRGGGFPPEPIRFIGAHIVRTAVVWRERAEMRDQKPSWVALKLSKLAPSGLEDKK
jgi:glycine/D-amino acid oxidase-like deaminating enzyme